MHVMRLLAISFAFLLGSLPFAVWLGRLAGIDPRTVGDGNPGATNAWKAGGRRLGVLVLALDVAKAWLPVWLARTYGGWGGLSLVAIALAPTLGHAFSPFLRGHGGKGLATIFGVWAGLTPYALGALALGMGVTIALLGWRLRDGWAVQMGLLTLAAFGLWQQWETALWVLLGIHAAWLAWMYRHDMRAGLRKEPRHA
ncbi:glycerol-3-phosphate acyltransferase PlsY [Ardenticatena maritima]|uniref:Glycerol-3-phosphate acyltransferase n=2 Tax=Ardenticatena maritima TaxID=872965 RepID=A0A0M8K5L3_9CHLR|nr:glycerol-3-phosphate acyltransferase [Ardenticatena maritima]GAP62203.1 glycerol-3-phosphate acyltransferase PlsY [Ardenticatena maritima]